MESRLIPINAMAALLSPETTSWPSTLHDAGYRLVGLEIPLDTPRGRVIADLVAFNAATNYFLVTECKSGRNINPDQAIRYSHIDAPQLVRSTDATMTASYDLSVEILYACLADNRNRVLLGLKKAGCGYPVISVGAEHLALDPNESTGPMTLSVTTTIPVSGPPPAIIRVDEGSSTEEFYKVTAQALVSEIARGTDSISVPDLSGRTIPHLHIYGTKVRRRLIREVEKAAENCCAAAPEIIRFRPRTANRDYAVINVTDSPETVDPRGRTQRYQSLGRKLRGLPPGQQPDSGQLPLFDMITMGTELEAEIEAFEITNEDH